MPVLSAEDHAFFQTDGHVVVPDAVPPASRDAVCAALWAFLGMDPRAPDLTGFAVTPVPARAGDLVIWDRLLAHGNGHNVSNRPRLAQYVTMFPARPDDEDFRRKRVAQWHDRLPPDTDWAPGDPRGWRQEHGRTADLSPLGCILLGLDAWPAGGTP